MKTLLNLIIITLTLSGCASTGINSGTGKGWIYTDVKESELVTANQAGKRRGESCATNILGLFSNGDASLSAAMKDAAITIVSSVDHYYNSVFVFYGKYCTVVTGI